MRAKSENRLPHPTCWRVPPCRGVIIYVKGDADENGQMTQLSQRPSVSVLKIQFYLLFMIEIYLQYGDRY